MYPYFVESKSLSVSLFQLSDGRFQLIKQGNLSKYLSGVNYILIENNLANFLFNMDIPLIEFKDAVIWNRKLKIEDKNYQQLIVKGYITDENFEHLDLSGFQMYLFGGGNLFVSPSLKEELENAEFNYLIFGEGFSRFAV